MIFSGWSDFPCELRTADLRPMGEGRPEGVHMSDIVRWRMVAEGMKVSDVMHEPTIQLGFLWEQALEYMLGGLSLDAAIELAFKRHMLALREEQTKQLRVEKDGIHMTPDAFDDKAGVVESYKSTAKSLGRALTQSEFESNFWSWYMADAGYAWALGVDSVRYIVLWRAGDYSRGAGTPPAILECTLTWTPEELASNWAEVLSIKEKL